MKTITKNLFLAACVAVTAFMFNACSGKKTEQKPVEEAKAVDASEYNKDASAEPAEAASDKGIGPVTSVEIGPLDNALAEKGKSIFETKCSACHKFEAKYVGPALGGVTKRRSPEWVMNMIMNPVEMTQKDPVAKKLLEEHLTQMTFQDLTQDEARAIYEYFRSVDETK
jgi:mono/diheme cytochrome c family protein